MKSQKGVDRNTRRELSLARGLLSVMAIELDDGKREEALETCEGVLECVLALHAFLQE